MIFKNVKTSEYLFYEICLNAKSSGILEVIRLSTCVRNKVTRKIRLQNPISSSVIYNLESDSRELSFDKSVEVPACKEVPMWDVTKVGLLSGFWSKYLLRKEIV